MSKTVERTEPTRRERQQEATREEIKAIARRQMAERGAAALSLRAIAAAMGLTAPALYRYYERRDDLITALIVDAFDALGAVVGAACDTRPPDDYAGQFGAAMLAYREWALAHEADFKLIYGTPIPGYHAPENLTGPAAFRSLVALSRLLGEAWRAGRLTPPAEYAETPPALRAHLEAWAKRGFDYDVPTAVLRTGFVAWTQLQGLIMLELFGHIEPVVGDADALYRAEVRALIDRMGLPPQG